MEEFDKLFFFLENKNGTFFHTNSVPTAYSITAITKLDKLVVSKTPLKILIGSHRACGQK